MKPAFQVSRQNPGPIRDFAEAHTPRGNDETAKPRCWCQAVLRSSVQVSTKTAVAPRLGRGPDLPLNLPLAAAVIAISLRHIPESSSPGLSRGDWPGALFAALGLGGLVTGLIESASLGWAHPLVFGSLVGGVVSLIVFMRVEASSVAPMVPLNLFASATFSGANLLTLFLYSAIGIFFFLFPLNLIQVQRYSATSAGAAALPFILLMFILSRWSGGLVKRCGPRRPLLIGPLIAASGFVLLAITSAGGSYWKTFFPSVLVLGLGMAVTVAPLTTVVMSSAGQDRVGTASGINNAVARVAGVLAIAVLGTVMVTAFEYRLNHQLASLPLSHNVLHEIKVQEIRLAALEVPANLDTTTRLTIGKWVREAFVFGFQLVMLMCAALSLFSATSAWWLISNSS
ncbi:MAG: hypothetical protein DMG89_04205 [Acidobacteria bacterium]|nr:MAG: hypothetical protein DMG89_04205 [Acidobacteriota bacterium]